MFKIFKKQNVESTVTEVIVDTPTRKADLLVQKIHKEFDDVESKILKECEDLLSSLEIPTESQLERKAKLMKQIGFVNSEIVTQAEVLEKRNQEVVEKKVKTEKIATSIMGLKVKYPKEKFITIDELDRICKKYNLIHAPVKNYVKDIPEKNLLEIADRKKLDQEDKYPLNKYLFKVMSFHSNSIQKDKLKGKEFELTLTVSEYLKIEENIFESDVLLSEKLGLERPIRGKSTLYKTGKITQINKQGLFIAAPQSHFNLKGLDKKSEFGYFNVTIREIKDPVVFEFCKNGLVRIISKWGTSDDQSYLDPMLTNENHN